MEALVQKFIPNAEVRSFQPLSDGLIHQTYKVLVQSNAATQYYILQRLNTAVFKKPFAVMKNLRLVQQHIDSDYSLLLPQALKTTDKGDLHCDSAGEFWRMFVFVENSQSFEIAPANSYIAEAGRSYGVFLGALKNFDANLLELTIPDFHHLQRRYDVFQQKIQSACPQRLSQAKREIDRTCEFYRNCTVDLSGLPLRAVHNDCKLSNLLFDKTSGECLAVIDLDTLMPGTIATDFGDMVRGLCNTATEEERDLNQVSFNIDHYKLLEGGFLDATKSWLTCAERESLAGGAHVIILEQAIRFLSDFLDNDTYYGAAYPGHNHHRARNQLTFLASMLEQI
ncbi:hypothetical protein AB833_00095 [Chromatiales bacterium (ex Bugula neritina AB1)]|nr:hypothetical protein AB833_00095 [Chromatiales bacterium (ex Bugula neritina AB1)]